MNDITDEMVEAAAGLMTVRAWSKLDDEEKTFWLGEARKVLEAALAGRTVVELPEPDMEGSWLDGAVSFAEDADEDAPMWHAPFITLRDECHAEHPDDAEMVGLALVAAARASRRLAAESSEGGDPR